VTTNIYLTPQTARIRERSVRGCRHGDGAGRKTIPRARGSFCVNLNTSVGFGRVRKRRAPFPPNGDRAQRRNTRANLLESLFFYFSFFPVTRKHLWTHLFIVADKLLPPRRRISILFPGAQRVQHEEPRATTRLFCHVARAS